MSTITNTSIHQFTIDNLQGQTLNFSDFEGKKILLVNVASECGLTPQYQQLVDLYTEFGEKIVIVGCPANNFGAQEPGSDAEIQQFCSTKYSVTFPMTTKISVKGNDMHPLYQFVTQAKLNGFQDSEVQWNFQKYIFDEQGQLTHVFNPQVEPADSELLAALGIHL